MALGLNLGVRIEHCVGVNDITVSRERSNGFNLVTGDLLNFYISQEISVNDSGNS